MSNSPTAERDTPEAHDAYWREQAIVGLASFLPGAACVLTGADPLPVIGSYMLH